MGGATVPMPIPTDSDSGSGNADRQYLTLSGGSCCALLSVGSFTCLEMLLNLYFSLLKSEQFVHDCFAKVEKSKQPHVTPVASH